ncbi:hypothetical protein MES4922_30568 [Mesorhizobium ventifaucium]|uniref:Uncharacterized protein n=1 Tax=Mesorhizobium ventifaucium TaxID=666020 RepID=A0ABM9DZI3_9HYPH|nr:hypothetical protein MES4922_30568 [Mesorhizobium ventifaucium]
MIDPDALRRRHHEFSGRAVTSAASFAGENGTRIAFNNPAGRLQGGWHARAVQVR